MHCTNTVDELTPLSSSTCLRHLREMPSLSLYVVGYNRSSSCMLFHGGRFKEEEEGAKGGRRAHGLLRAPARLCVSPLQLSPGDPYIKGTQGQ